MPEGRREELARRGAPAQPRALKPSGVTGACRSYTSPVMLGASPTLERTPYHYLLRVPLPGVLRYTLKVHLKDDTLIVSGRWEGAAAGGAVCYGSVRCTGRRRCPRTRSQRGSRPGSRRIPLPSPCPAAPERVEPGPMQ